MTLLLLSLIGSMLVDVTVQQAGKLDFEIHVKQDESRFIQTVSSNMYENMVYYHTPKHNHTSETHLMQDFNQDVQIRCFPELKHCYLSKLEQAEYPNATVSIENVAKMWKQGINSINTDKSEKIVHRWGINGSEITDVVFLGSNLRHFVSRFNYPLFRVDQLPPNGNIFQGNGRNQTRTISVRNVVANVGISPRKCQSGKYATLRWVATTTHCEHLFVCRDRFADDTHPPCRNLHISGAQYFKCYCCDEDDRKEQCVLCRHVNV